MENFISILNQTCTDIKEKFQNNKGILKNKRLSNNDDHYLDILYNLKKVTLTKFAEIAKVTKPGATQIINKFVKEGYVTKTVSNEDKRVCYIELTEQIQNNLEKSYQKINEFYQDCLSFLSEEELNEFYHILLKIHNNL